MQKHKRRSLTLMILGALVLVGGLVWMAQDATTVMAHECADGNPPVDGGPPDRGEECPTGHTPTPTATNTARPPDTGPPLPLPSTHTPTATYTAMPTATSTAMPRPTAAPRPGTPCIVTHAATPAQLCESSKGLQYYFIGPSGVQTGPYLSSFSELAEMHSLVQAVVELYRGTNPMTGKPIRIDYLPNEKVIRVSTYYADTPYSKDKPYIFTVNTSHEVTNQAW